MKIRNLLHKLDMLSEEKQDLENYIKVQEKLAEVKEFLDTLPISETIESNEPDHITRRNFLEYMHNLATLSTGIPTVEANRRLFEMNRAMESATQAQMRFTRIQVDRMRADVIRAFPFLREANEDKKESLPTSSRERNEDDERI